MDYLIDGIIIVFVMLWFFGQYREKETECMAAYDRGDYRPDCSKYYQMGD